MVRTFYSLITRILINIISGYQYFISPFLPPSCRFPISCSEYAKLAIVQHGLVRGSFLGAVRLLKCHAFSKNL